MREWKRSHTEASLLDPVVVEAAPDSLDGLMAEMDTILASYDRLDMEALVVKIMAMVRIYQVIPSCTFLCAIFTEL